MPDRFENLLTLRGSTDELAAARDALGGPAALVDFARLLPVPRELSPAQARERCLSRWGASGPAEHAGERPDLPDGVLEYWFQTQGGPPIAYVARLASEHRRLAITLMYFAVSARTGLRRRWRDGLETDISEADLDQLTEAVYAARAVQHRN